MIELTNDNFDEVVSEGAILVDFWASWCGPCRVMNPILEDIDKDVVRVGKVDVDDNQKLQERFGVLSIPTCILFDENGNEVKRVIGALPKAKFVDRLDLPV